MTPQEAITELLTDKLCLMAVASHPSLVNVEEIGIAISALEKQIPKKIKTEYITRELKRYRCPVCNQHYYDISHKHCHFCGQALDWSDTE